MWHGVLEGGGQIRRLHCPLHAQEVMQRGVERIGKIFHEKFDRQSLQPEETLFVTSEDVVAEEEQGLGVAAKAGSAQETLASDEGRVLLRLLRSWHSSAGT